MNVVNCRKCGRVFNHIGGPQICPKCKEEAEKKFQEVKAYIRENTTCTMAEVCEACDVEPSQIQNWVRQERLQFTSDSPIKVSCEQCGALINSGRFCAKCKDKMTKNLTSVIAKPAVAPKESKPGDNKNKMRFL